MQCLFNFTNDVVVITGAASGLGAALSAQLLTAGATVIGLDISDQISPELAREYDVTGLHLLKVNVTDEESVRSTFTNIRSQYGPISLLVNAVGIYPHSPLANLELSEWRRVMDVNLTSTYLCTRFFALGHPEKMTASVINIASISGIYPELTHSHYNAAKAGVIMFTRTSALNLAAQQIRVNAVAPGLLDNAALRQNAPERVARFLARAPLGFITTYTDISNAVLFLASEQARSITGQTLIVDSGVTIAEVY